MAKKTKDEIQAHFDRRRANQYTDLHVNEDTTLMPFLMKQSLGTRTRVKELLTSRMVFVNHQITTQYNAPVRKGDLVQILKKRNVHEFHSDKVKIIYEDAFLMVVNKSNGILTSPSSGNSAKTVKDLLNEYVKHQSKFLSVHTVHRLDRETSGLLIFAKRRDVQKAFMDNWKGHVIDRRYVAVVEGEVEKDEGTVTSWLKDNKMFVTYSSPIDNGGQYAVTHYRTMQRLKGFSLLELVLETGKKNQIRVHMQDIGHPIVGDYKYGSHFDPVGRVALHAIRIAFYHPITHELLDFETPVPDDFLHIPTLPHNRLED